MRNLLLLALLIPLSSLADPKPIPPKTVVLTFDDAPRSHGEFVAPLLKKLGFGATFFISEGFNFTTDKKNFLTWEEIRKLHDDGFEIGNHTRHHTAVIKQNEAQLRADVEYIDRKCAEFGIPKPVTFCYPAYRTNEQAVRVLRDMGFRMARSGGKQAADLTTDEPLKLPQAFDGKPDRTLKDFIAAAEMAKEGKAAIFTFHGVPDRVHPWVNTEPEKFEAYMQYLKDNDYNVIALRDLIPYLPATSKEP